jgi:hypothetical protein
LAVAGEYAFRSEHDFLDCITVTQAIHDEICSSNSVCWRFCDARAFPSEWFAFLGASIPNGKLIAGFEKIRRYTAAHRAEAKIRDFSYHLKRLL